MKNLLHGGNAHCTMCCLCSLSSSQPNKLRHILKFVSWYPIQHIFVPACSIARNSYKKMFLWTSNSKSAIFPKMYPSVSHRGDFRHWGTLLYKQHYTPVSHIGGILDTGVHDCPNSTLCIGGDFWWWCCWYSWYNDNVSDDGPEKTRNLEIWETDDWNYADPWFVKKRQFSIFQPRRPPW